MKGSGIILIPVYDPFDVQCTIILHYMSEIKIQINNKIWQQNYITPVNVFNDVKKTEDGYKNYVRFLESYLKRSVANVMLNDGVQFKYA